METEELDFSRICRVCCTEGPTLPLFRVNLHRKVMACTAIQVWQNDGLPGQICKKCVAKLHISFQFKKLCEKSDVYLRRCRDSGKFTDSKKSKTMIVIEVDPTESCNTKSVETETSTTLSLPGDCNFSNCSIQPLTDNREYVSIQSFATDVHVPVEPQSLYCNEILVDEDIPIRDQYDLSGNFTTHSLGNITLDSSFSNQIMSQSVNVTDQILTLESLSASNQLQPIQKPSNQTFGLSQISIPSITDDNKEIITPIIEKDKQKTNTVKNNVAQVLHCPICNKSYDTVSKLNRHSRTHSDEILYRCEVCHKGFIHGGNYKVHLRTHTDERPYSCHLCPRRCRSQQDLNKHIRIHTGEKPHVCSFCNKAFSTSSNLVAHERIHKREKPYICVVCQKAFCQSSELKKHIRTHTGEKSHYCQFCKKGFNGSSKLISHMRTHNGAPLNTHDELFHNQSKGPPYICSICQKEFKLASSLANHKRKHVGRDSNSFLCLICSRSFTTFSDLQKHVASHSPSNYACPEPGCLKNFCRPYDLLRHTKISHCKQPII